MCNSVTVYTQYRRVTDVQTDGQTSSHGIVRAMHTRRAVKTTMCFEFLYIVVYKNRWPVLLFRNL